MFNSYVAMFNYQRVSISTTIHRLVSIIAMLSIQLFHINYPYYYPYIITIMGMDSTLRHFPDPPLFPAPLQVCKAW